MKKSRLLIISMIITLASTLGKAQTIKQVTIGNQIWMSENLNVSKFKNGDPIKEAKSKEDWVLASTNKEPAWCYVNNDSITKYGKLYNLYAVIDPRGLAPQGWHVCSLDEVNVLIANVGGISKAGASLKSQIIKGKDIYYNKYKFSGLLCGYRDAEWDFMKVSAEGKYWTSTTEIYSRKLYAQYFMLANYAEQIYIHSGNDKDGLSVRCVKD